MPKNTPTKPLPRWSDNPREYNRLYLVKYNAARVADCRRRHVCRDCLAPSKDFSRCLGCRLTRQVKNKQWLEERRAA